MAYDRRQIRSLYGLEALERIGRRNQKADKKRYEQTEHRPSIRRRTCDPLLLAPVSLLVSVGKPQIADGDSGEPLSFASPETKRAGSARRSGNVREAFLNDTFTRRARRSAARLNVIQGSNKPIVADNTSVLKTLNPHRYSQPPSLLSGSL